MQGPVAIPTPNYTKAKRISLKNHPSINEKWIQDLIASDPSILGLGDDLKRIGKEVRLPGGGRLDLLLANESEHYEVEVQLGATDPSHIIRTIEYWDLERSRYPECEHVAVLVAEDITSRFLNVVSLLNRSVPLIAIQMQALEVGSNLTFVFTTVVDRVARPDEDGGETQTADRAYWEKKCKEGLEIADELATFVQGSDPASELSYNLGRIQIRTQGRILVSFTPQKVQTKIKVRMSMSAESEELRSKLEQSGLEVKYREMGIASGYRVAVDNEKFKEHAAAIKNLVLLGLKEME